MFKLAPTLLFFLTQFLISSANRDEILEKLHHGLENVLNFVYKNKDDFNLDGLFDVVVLKAQLESVTKNNLAPDDLVKIQNHLKKASTILSESKITKRNLSPNYRIFAKHLFKPSIWKKNVNFTSGNLNALNFVPKFKSCEELEYYLTSPSLFNESLSDFCFSQLINSSIDKSQNCEINEFCLHNMVENTIRAFGYEITHRLLYLQIGNAIGCKWNKRWLNTKIKNYCSYIYWEALNNANCRFISSLDDIFLEQISMCGFEGYSEFFEMSWIEYVLSIQADSGCFTAFTEDEETIQKSELKRKKREYNILKENCVDHTTGLGAGVLGLFLKYLLQTKDQF